MPDHASLSERQIFNVNQAAQYSGICRDAIMRLCREGKIAHVHVGRRILIHRQALDRFVLEGHSHDPAAILAEHGVRPVDLRAVAGSRRR